MQRLYLALQAVGEEHGVGVDLHGPVVALIGPLLHDLIPDVHEHRGVLHGLPLALADRLARHPARRVTGERPDAGRLLLVHQLLLRHVAGRDDRDAIQAGARGLALPRRPDRVVDGLVEAAERLAIPIGLGLGVKEVLAAGEVLVLLVAGRLRHLAALGDDAVVRGPLADLHLRGPRGPLPELLALPRVVLWGVPLALRAGRLAAREVLVLRVAHEAWVLAALGGAAVVPGLAAAGAVALLLRRPVFGPLAQLLAGPQLLLVVGLLRVAVHVARGELAVLLVALHARLLAALQAGAVCAALRALRLGQAGDR
mmetsp:Transcript_12142/g.33874  ORF Transcript_12142/g.33874 Transcript_12142/m.33874 type:complete len:312 (-) Transcript_12142:62-997(-)